MLKRLVVGALLSVSIGLGGATSASAAGGGNGNTVVETPVSWTVSWENCNQLPAGITVYGEGRLVDILLKSGGVESQGRGSASDNLGNTYQWHYASHLTAHNSGFIDHFNLSGNGPAAYVTGFRAVFTAAGIEPVWVHGDPFAFPDGGGRCDPL
jgi:hypothetical protein